MPKPEVAPEKSQEKPEKQEKEITILLDENNQPVKEPEKKDEPKYVTAEMLATTVADALKKATAPLYYEMRKVREPQAPAQPAPVQPKVEPNEWDKKLQGDWKGTVEELAEQKFKKMMDDKAKQDQIQYQQQQENSIREDSKKKALAKHPELNDETSQKSEIFRQVMQENPDYLINPRGPILVMRDMEDKLRDMGVVDNSTRQAVDKEVARVTRTNAGSLPKGNPSVSKNSVTLTKDQKEFCDANGLKYENYAKFVRQNEAGRVEA